MAKWYSKGTQQPDKVETKIRMSKNFDGGEQAFVLKYLDSNAKGAGFTWTPRPVKKFYLGCFFMNDFYKD